MKDFFLILRNSKLISIFWGASLAVLIDILFWLIGWESFSILTLASAPFIGGFIGYASWKINQIKVRNKKETKDM